MFDGERPMIKFPWSRDKQPLPERKRGLRAFLERHVPGVAVTLGASSWLRALSLHDYHSAERRGRRALEAI